MQATIAGGILKFSLNSRTEDSLPLFRIPVLTFLNKKKKKKMNHIQLDEKDGS